MAVDWSQASGAIGGTALVSNIIPLVLGGIFTLLRPWLLSEEEFRHRVGLLREVIVEKQSKKLASLLERNRDTSKPIRGETADTDPIADYVKESLRVLAVCKVLDRLRDLVRSGYTILLVATIAALIGILLALPFPELRPWIAVAGYCLILGQVVTVLYLRSRARVLEGHESTQ